MRRAACAAGLAVIALTGCSGVDDRVASSTPAATITVTATPSATASPALPGRVAADDSAPYDAAMHQDPDEDGLPKTTKAQRDTCAIPSQSLIDRVLYAVPITGAGPSVERAVAASDQGETFVALVTDVGTGTWVINEAVSPVGVLALDQDAADISGYELQSEQQHDVVDFDNGGRGLVLSCLQRGFPGDERAAG